MNTWRKEAKSLTRARQLAWGVALFLLLISPFAESPSGYLFATIPICACVMIWMHSGAEGIPALPIASALYWVYYALPLLRIPSPNYSASDYDEAGITVGIFLACATFSWWIISRRPSRRRQVGEDEAAIDESQIFLVVCLGLLCGLAYLVALFAGGLEVFGTFVGVVRSVAYTYAAVASFLLGYARGNRWLTGGYWIVAVTLFCAYLMLNMFSLYISGGAALLLGAIFGYTLSSKKIPIVTLVALLGVFSILHAGKGEMRLKYWDPETPEASADLSDAPEFFVSWVTNGIANISTGKAAGDAALERTSLLQMLLLAQYATPRLVPFLDGATYSYLATTLVPRFLDPDKATSQSGLNLMSVHYGLQQVEDTRSTTIAWGLVAEAFANFGLIGVVSIGLLFGVLNGFATRISIGKLALSTPFLLAAAVTLNLLNVESDFSFLILNIGQSIISVMVFTTLVRFLRRKRRSSPTPVADPVSVLPNQLARVGLRRGLQRDF